VNLANDRLLPREAIFQNGDLSDIVAPGPQKLFSWAGRVDWNRYHRSTGSCAEAIVNREYQPAAFTLIALTAGAVSLAALALPAQGGDKPAPAAATYTEEQSTRGEAVSMKSCAVCHGEQLKGDLAPPLQGDDFRKSWSDKTAGALFDKIITTMPANEPGTISEQQSADLVAYILKLNHFPAGQEPLPRDLAALNAIPLAPK
jgi:mono/diheme cytochrome c family protein